MGIMLIFRECNKIITALQSPSVFLHEAYSIILQHIRTLFDYSCEMVVKELKNGSRIMGWLFDCAIESANITNVLKFTRVYVINLMKRFVNISGTTSIPINQIARIETFDMFMEVFYKENKNNPCLKDLIQTNPDLFDKIMIYDIGSIVRDNLPIKTTAIMATTSSVESIFSRMKMYNKVNVKEATLLNMLYISNHLKGCGSTIWKYTNNNIYPTLYEKKDDNKSKHVSSSDNNISEDYD